jgi:uncharacterized protein HemX
MSESKKHFLSFLGLSVVLLVSVIVSLAGGTFLYRKIQALEVHMAQLQEANRLFSHQVKDVLSATQALSQMQAKQQAQHQQIEQEIEAVQALIKQNTLSSTQRSLWQQIDGLHAYFKQLQFKSLEEVNIAPPAPTHSWQNAWEELKSLIRVTRESDNRIPVLLAYQEKAEIVRALQGWCEQAQWAILHQDHAMYVKSVEHIESLVQDYFMPDPTQVTLLNVLHQLEAVREIA